MHNGSNPDHPEFLRRYVRLNLTGEVVEVESSNSSDVSVRYGGLTLTFPWHEVKLVSPEEAAASKQKPKKLNQRQFDGECTASTRSVAHCPDASRMQFHQFFRNR
jgi:hypothetical protein